MFISSTLQELAAERGAVRAAVERLRFTPVLFELGARPHPPRALYRAYLEQSDVFVGIYWQRYGWVAPGMDISGLEDEYRLAAALPRLVYVKGLAGRREQRLDALLKHIGADGVSYRHFETSEELRDLVADDLALLASERFDRSSTHRGGAAASIPSPASSFIGRASEVDDVVMLLRRPEIRLVTLVGPGGIGKTRLALEAARLAAGEFGDGALFVPLASVSEPDDVQPAVAEALGVEPGPDLPLGSALRARLASLEFLLVLDNLEHVLSATPFIAELLAAAPGLTVLATSRSRLDLSGEHLFHVPPLDLPAADERAVDAIRHSDAVALFAVRAQASGWTASDGDIPMIADIVRRLDGLPLAIELAAAQARLSPAELIQTRLRRRLDLGGGPRDAEERHRTLRSAIAWSYELLDEPARRFFDLLSVFVGGFSLAAAAALLEEGEDVEGFVGTLLDASLVTTSPSPATGVRFGMLETIREFAAERLEERGERAEVVRRYIAYYAELADEAYGASIEQLVVAHMRQDEERDNLRAALDEAIGSHPAEGLRLAGALEHLWSSRGLAREGRAAIARALESAPDAPPSTRARALLSAAWLAAEQGDCAEADRLALQALELFRALGDRRNEGEALNALGWSADRRGDMERALRYFEQSYRAFSELSDESPRVLTTMHLANWLAARGESEDARRLYVEAARTFERHGLDDAHASALFHLGSMDERSGDLVAARRSYEASRDVARRIDNKRVLAEALVALGHVNASEGLIEEAGRSYAEAVAIQLELADRLGAARSLEHLAAVLSRDDAQVAARLLGAAKTQRTAFADTASPTEAEEAREIEHAVRAALGDARFEEEASSGAALGSLDLRALVEGVTPVAAAPDASVRI